jgi:hypothetical protein
MRLGIHGRYLVWLWGLKDWETPSLGLMKSLGSAGDSSRKSKEGVTVRFLGITLMVMDDILFVHLTPLDLAV